MLKILKVLKDNSVLTARFKCFCSNHIVLLQKYILFRVVFHD